MRFKKRIIIIVAFSVLLCTFSFYFYQIVFTPNILVNDDEVTLSTTKDLFIPPNATFKDVQNILYKGNYLNDLVTFSFLAKILDYDQHVKAGRYVLHANMTNLALVKLLKSGTQTPIQLTFNNIRTKDELAERIAAQMAFKKKQFNEILHTKSIVDSLGFTEENITTMFIPNTYEVYWSTSALNLINRMKLEHTKFWTDARLAKANSLQLTPQEVSILASIVQAESNQPEEMPIIAGLYINRLKKGMKLEADPTVIFAHQDFTITRVLKKHLTIDSPYNTYKYTGLPPGPIKIPSIQAIDAVLNYQQHDYIYFCAKEDFSGYHNFTKDYTEHLKNAKKFQKALNNL